MLVGLKTHMVDLYVREIFYDFRLFLVLENYCGVDLGSYLGHKKDKQGKTLWILWVHLMMGMVLAISSVVQGLKWSSEVVSVDSSDPYKPFRWDKIRLNLPVEPNYSTKISWVSIV